MKARYNFLLSVLLLIEVSSAATLSGYVVDQETGETVIGVNVFIAGTDHGASTDVNGFFVINGLPADTMTIIFSHIAYQELRQEVDLRKGDGYLSQVSMEQRTLETKAIEVVANRGAVIQRDMDIASFEADPVLLKEVPQLNKDVFQLIKYSPSVSITEEFSPLYNVRGSDPGENLVLLDGMTIYNPQHFLSGEAIFNPYAIKNIELLVGGFDAEYGGRNASILYITTREGHQEKTLGEFKPSISGLVGAVEFPVRSVGTAMLSGRFNTSWVNQILLGVPNYRYDFNFALQSRMGRTRIRFSAFTARDYMDYDASRFVMYMNTPELEDYRFGFKTITNNLVLGLQSRTILSPTLIFEARMYQSGFEVTNRSFMNFSFRDTTLDLSQTMNYETRILNKIQDRTLKAKLVWFTFWGQALNLGTELTRYNFENGYGLLSSQGFQLVRRADLQAWYLQDKIDLGHLLVKIGRRYSRFAAQKKWIQDPRVSLALHLGFGTLKAAWGRYHQFLTSMNTQDFEIVQSVDYYYPLQTMEPLESEQFILGFERRVSDHLDYTLTAYFKDLSTLYRYDYQNTTRTLLSYSASLERGSGKAYGLESLLRGEWGRLSGWVTYAYSVSTRRYPSLQQGKSFLADGDQTHRLKALVTLRINRDITASTTLQFTSGYPKTWETGLVNHYTYDPVENKVGTYQEFITPVKNNVRYPSRLNIDLGWKKKLRSGFGYRLAEFLGTGDAYFTMTVQNILFLRRNPWIYIYLPEYGYYGYDPFFLPTVSMGYSIKF
ncbi:MAG: carboxypeptidase-like regulatory domain-containing protein [Fidelibacterota bacterium]